MDKFLKDTHQYIIDHTHLDCSQDRLLVALSGGADSVCLLMVLRHLGYRCGAAHCNFHLRGAESDRDEYFVRQFCQTHDVPLHIAHFDTRQEAAARHESIELAARRLRYQWFSDLTRTEGYDALCVGHHRDDNIETLLLNIVRGTGIQGLCGMEPDTYSHEFQLRIVRPLLSMSHHDIEQWLTSQQQTWITDSTNLEDCATRNRIRHHVIPLLTELNPAAPQNLQRTISNLRDVRQLYDVALQQHVHHCVCWISQEPGRRHLIIDRERLRLTPSPLTVLHAILSPLGFNGTQIRNLLTAKGYRNNRPQSINPIRIPHTDHVYNVIVGWKEIEVEEKESLL